MQRCLCSTIGIWLLFLVAAIPAQAQKEEWPEAICAVSELQIKRIALSPDDRYVLVEQFGGQMMLFEVSSGKLFERSLFLTASIASKMEGNSLYNSFLSDLDNRSYEYVLQTNGDRLEVFDGSGKSIQRYNKRGEEILFQLVPHTPIIVATAERKSAFGSR